MPGMPEHADRPRVTRSWCLLPMPEPGGCCPTTNSNGQHRPEHVAPAGLTPEASIPWGSLPRVGLVPLVGSTRSHVLKFRGVWVVGRQRCRIPWHASNDGNAHRLKLSVKPRTAISTNHGVFVKDGQLIMDPMPLSERLAGTIRDMALGKHLR